MSRLNPETVEIELDVKGVIVSHPSRTYRIVGEDDVSDLPDIDGYSPRPNNPY